MDSIDQKYEEATDNVYMDQIQEEGFKNKKGKKRIKPKAQQLIYRSKDFLNQTGGMYQTLNITPDRF